MTPDRRTFLAQAGLAALAVGSASTLTGCGSSGSGRPAPSTTVTVPAASVPVDGGVVLTDAQFVVTQPSEGVYKAFSSTCTHQGCTVREITNREIVCPCHGASFSIEDGSVINGPATEPLPEATVTLDGDEVKVGG